ncbi:long-chain fatty acid synthase-related protein [Cyclospora cayetanensis]|uniref:Long-chain fatty acid synthase-related protein n=1 Tax=Cyclospora cayetanensis TaxID=88456 RepID=A0A1D3CW83_9EIME|nr:long-chain fatty acid synthase-related protein [Cyclospora cayetanensis]
MSSRGGFQACLWWELFQMGVGKAPEGPCLGTRQRLPDGKRGAYVWKTYREVERLALEAGSGLLNGDLVPLCCFDSGSDSPLSLRCIGIFAKNREEWIITEHACNAFGITAVPLYDTLGSHSTQFILSETQMKTVVSDGNCLPKLLDALQQHQSQETNKDGSREPLPVKVVITLDDISDTEKETANSLHLQLLPWNKLLEMGRENMIPLTDDVQPTMESLHTICYTSGTTGNPKGVMMTHGNFVAAVSTAVEGPLSERNLYLDSSDCLISYLPLAHVYERFCENLFFSYGGRVGFYSGDTHKLLEDVQVLKPTVFCSVPRLFQRIEDRVISSLQGKSFLARSLFQQGGVQLVSPTIVHLPVGSGEQVSTPCGVLLFRLALLIVFDKFRGLMGGRVRIMLTGSAPLDPYILERMRAFFCCWIVEGYGMTETMGASFLTWNVYDRHPGQVGGVLPCLEFCLLDVSESMGKYSIKDPIPKGELCVRGPTVSSGYFRNPTETAAAIDQDGWLHTGDIVALLPNGGIQIIDRKKNIFKLAQGEYVAPEKIEAVYMQSRFVEQCFVFGFSSESLEMSLLVISSPLVVRQRVSRSLACFAISTLSLPLFSLQNSLVAIVVPDQGQTLKWLAETRGSSSASTGCQPFAELIQDSQLQQAIYEDMQQVGKKQGLKGFELARKIHLRAEQFTVENGLLTPTFKLKRHYAKEVFADEIAAMYAKIHEEHPSS